MPNTTWLRCGQVGSLVEAASWTKGLKSMPYAPGKLGVKEEDYVPWDAEPVSPTGGPVWADKNECEHPETSYISGSIKTVIKEPCLLW